MKAGRLLILYLVLLFLGVLHPFVLEWRPVVVPAPNFFDFRLQSLDPAVNLLLFVPFGLLVRALGLGRLGALLAALATSAGIELAQHWVAHRVAGIEDLLLNTAGGGFGALLFEHPSAARFGRFLERRPARAALLALCLAFILWSAAPPVVGAELWRWHCDAAVTTGANALGENPWPGKIHHAAIYAGAHTPDALSGRDPDWSMSREGSGVRARSMCGRILEADAFTIDLDVTMPPDRHQKPFGAIIVYAHDFSRMNMAVGHIRRELILRVKTRATPILGAFPDDERPLVIDAYGPSERHRLTITFDGVRTAAFTDGLKVSEQAMVMPAHNGQRRFWLPRGPLGAWLYAFSAALVGAAGAAGLFAPRRAFLAGVMVAVATELIQVLVFSRGLDASQLPFICLGAGLGSFCGGLRAAPIVGDDLVSGGGRSRPRRRP